MPLLNFQHYIDVGYSYPAYLVGELTVFYFIFLNESSDWYRRLELYKKLFSKFV